MSVPDLFKIVARGLQDTRLQPKMRSLADLSQYITVYKSTTRWAAQLVRVDFDTNPDFGLQASVTLPRKYDFVHRLLLTVVLPDIYGPQSNASIAAATAGNTFLGPYFSWTNSVGHALIASVDLEIGGTRVASLDGRLLEVLDEFYESPEKLRAKNVMIGRSANYSVQSVIGPILHIPLPFWFTQHLAQSLPIEALSVDTVRLQINFNPVSSIYYTSARGTDFTVYSAEPPMVMPPLEGAVFYQTSASGSLLYNVSDTTPHFGVKGIVIPNKSIPSKLSMVDCYLLAEYISVDDYETVNLRNADLEYKVPLYNAVAPEDTKGQQFLRTPILYNNPTQDILWFFHNPVADLFNQPFLATRDLSGCSISTVASVPWLPDGTGFAYAYSEPLANVALTFNGVQRFSHSEPSLFRSLLPLIHYRKAPEIWRYYYLYTFSHGAGAWDDKELGNPYIPKGLANFDKILRKEMVFTLQADRFGSYPNLTLYLWTTTWNILRIYGGRGAFLFAI
jgi:hypothetical protein